MTHSAKFVITKTFSGDNNIVPIPMPHSLVFFEEKIAYGRRGCLGNSEINVLKGM